MGVTLAVLWATIGLAAAAELWSRRSRQRRAVTRRRNLWLACGAVFAVEAMLVVVALRLLTGWPQSPATVSLAVSGVVLLASMVALMGGTNRRPVASADRLLTRIVELVGLTALVLAVYVVVVLGLGRTPDRDERALLALSIAAAGIVALLYAPTRRWLTERANRMVYGTQIAPDQTLHRFAERLTRSIPLEELLLQLAESLRSSMRLVSADVWTGQHGRYEWTAGVPHRRPPPLTLDDTELPVVARAGVAGGTWLDIWVPDLVGPRDSSTMRVAPVAHSGLLLGFIVAERAPGDDRFGEVEDTVLADLARQVGLALHNVQLDAALQASLDELRRRNDELQTSRARIVSAGDAARRELERNLHDGAQQHLVALAVKVRLAQDALADDPSDAIAMLDDVKGEVQAAIDDLRALAHGIYPPLLVSGGLIDALPAAARRAALPTEVVADNLRRYGDDIEATVYFCIVESLQNAGKHAGAAARATVHVADRGEQLHFTVADDGVGFDTTSAREHGHGFVNMADRLGAVGGTIDLRSSPGTGTTITGTIPINSPGPGEIDVRFPDAAEHPG